MIERVEQPNSPNDWISGDADVVGDHARDLFNHFTSTPNIRSLYDFIQMMKNIIGSKWAAKVLTLIPFYNIAGDQDPVGLYGEGVYQVSNWLAETG